MNNYTEQAKELVMYCKLLYHRGYIAGIEGNLSIRLSEGRFMVTPRGLNKGLISVNDIIVCDPDGKKLEGVHEPSSEAKIHVAVYKHRSDINAVCHAHPTFATAYSLAGRSFDSAILPEFVATLGIAPLVKYGTPGSEKLASNLIEVLDKHDAFLLERHGSLTIGKSLAEAYNRTEILERYAKLLYYAGQIESPKLLSREETERLLDLGGRQALKGIIKSREDDR
jgi:L-fuculose-phosphate aldolase